MWDKNIKKNIYINYVIIVYYLDRSLYEKAVFGYFFSLLLSACSDPKSITISSVQDIQKHSEEIKKLADEEKELLGEYVIRKEAGKIFGAGDGIPPNTKIGDAIEDQRKFKVKRAKEQEEEKIVQKKAQAEMQAKIDAINNSVQVIFISKSLDLKNKRYDFDDVLTVEFKVTNKTQRILSGIKGNVTFYDKFGDEISTIQLKIDFESVGGGLNPDGEYTDKKNMPLFGGLQKLAETEIDGMKYQFVPEMILFDDGTKMTLE